MEWQIGDTVRVKTGFVDDETGQEMGGWQGRVKEVFPKHETVMVAFDSVTLKAMPAAYIRQCEEEGFGWNEYGYETAWLEAAEPRHSGQTVNAAIQERAHEVRFAHLGEEGRRIDEILQEIDPDDEIDPFYGWEEYLMDHLTFPFAAEIAEAHVRGPLQVGDRVKVHSVDMTDDQYGVIVKLRRSREVYHFPLCDLKVLGAPSPEQALVQLYAVWFANR